MEEKVKEKKYKDVDDEESKNSISILEQSYIYRTGGLDSDLAYELALEDAHFGKELKKDENLTENEKQTIEALERSVYRKWKISRELGFSCEKCKIWVGLDKDVIIYPPLDSPVFRNYYFKWKSKEETIKLLKKAHNRKEHAKKTRWKQWRQ
jgi:hypothetical protein